MAFLRHDGLNFYYEEHGTGRPFIFSHGLSGSVGSTRELVAGLPGLRVILYDNRFHGQTNPLGGPTQLSFRQMADDMAAVLDHLGMPEALVGGSSMGAGIALAFALQHPERVTGLFLLRPAWLDQPNPPNLAVFPLIAELIDKYGYAGARAELEKTELFQLWQQTATETAKTVQGVFADHNPEALVALFRAMPASVPVKSREDLRRLNVPALVLGNRDCPVHPVEMAEELARHLPHGRLEIFPGRSENLAEHVRQFRRLVCDFANCVT